MPGAPGSKVDAIYFSRLGKSEGESKKSEKASNGEGRNASHFLNECMWRRMNFGHGLINSQHFPKFGSLIVASLHNFQMVRTTKVRFLWDSWLS